MALPTASAALRAGARQRPFEAGRGVLAAASRYALLAESIVEDIRKGRYAVGSMLPTEAVLCKQFGVSRHTVREALRKLGDMGLVSRHQGIGTRVKARQGSSRFVQSIDACAIAAGKARLLRVRAGSPGLSITRHYLGENDKLLLVSASLYPAGRFTCSMRLRASARDPGTRST